MVSLWPFRRSSTSAESFEKSLSALAQKIAKQSAHNDRIRQRARRVKVSWTLYGGFAYILAAIVLIFVTGTANWGIVEYTVMAGGPVLLYGVRAGFDAWYNYRVSTSQDYLDSLYKERDATIEKLKEATKYNSTEQLLKKYGSPRPSLSAEDGEKKPKSPSAAKKKEVADRVFIQPPPTANIQRPNYQQAPTSPQQQTPVSPMTNVPPRHPPEQRPLSPVGQSPTAEFAPNAFDTNLQYTSTPSYGESRWYDRILDALLGEDETQAKNRFALICQKCRLVNGQAPPGARTLEDVGRWRCQGCGTMNGVENEAERLVKQVSTERQKISAIPEEKREVQSEQNGEHESEEEIETPVEDQDGRED